MAFYGKIKLFYEAIFIIQDTLKDLLGGMIVKKTTEVGYINKNSQMNLGRN
jgi:hypothetical protein